MNSVIYLFGASCSGKSTLGKALQNTLGGEWEYIDRDDLVESGECSEETANAAIDEKVQQIKTRVIIDAQIPWRAKRTGESYYLIRSPLRILLERDAKRTTLLKREEERSLQTRRYVIETHQILEEIEQTQFDDCLDTSQMSVHEEIDLIRKRIF